MYVDTVGQFAGAEFVDTHDSFTVTLRKHPTERQDSASAGGADLVAFCSVPRSRIEIAQFLGLESVPYASRVYIAPAVREGVLRMTLPDKPRSSKQRYVAARKLLGASESPRMRQGALGRAGMRPGIAVQVGF